MAFPFLDSDAIISSLKAELPVYLAAAQDVNVLNEEQNSASLGCVYPAHGSASNTTLLVAVGWKSSNSDPKFHKQTIIKYHLLLI